MKTTCQRTITRMILPTGEDLHRDMSTLSDELVRHEYDLCYEILNGVYIGGELIEGMLNKDYENDDNSKQSIHARNVWLQRLENATVELMERALLS